MDSSPTTTTKSQQVTVDVPEDRVAEFHRFFGRFLAGRPARGRGGRYGRPHRGAHRRRCGERAEQGDTAAQPAESTEV